MPNKGVDPVVIAAHVITSLQSIVSRVTDPFESTVVSVTKMQGGTANNVIPDVATLAGTIRTLKPELRQSTQAQLRRIAEGIAAAHGAEASVTISSGYPVTVNHPGQTEAALAVASDVAGATFVNPATTPTMGGEDFSYMLEARPGNFIFIGNGDTAGLHNPNYDFNDEIIPYGVSYWVKLAETRLTQIA
jgi:hippurate hydrolase